MNRQTKNLVKALISFVVNLLLIALLGYLILMDVSFLQVLFHPATWFFAATCSVATYFTLEFKSEPGFPKSKNT